MDLCASLLVSRQFISEEYTAKAGLAPINDKRYDTKIKEHKHIKKIIKISMAFCGKEVAMQYQID